MPNSISLDPGGHFRSLKVLTVGYAEIQPLLPPELQKATIEASLHVAPCLAEDCWGRREVKGEREQGGSPSDMPYN